jgi:crotonobetainyl-CoA:carnitine CoA-transferase CaiB-like acyl-CoA transferase
MAAVFQARLTGEGSVIDLAQSDAAAFFDWYRIESWRSYERPDDEVYGNAADDGERRPPGTAGMAEGVRYQIYDASDGLVLFMASEREFWKNFCEAVGRPELFEKWPGSQYADHARGNQELRAELAPIFATKTVTQWLAFSQEFNTPIAPVNTPQSIADDPQFQERLPWIPKETLDADMLPFPAAFLGAPLPAPGPAPSAGQHSNEILRPVAGSSPDRIATLLESGAVQDGP